MWQTDTNAYTHTVYYTAWTYIHSYTHVCIRHDLVCIYIHNYIYMYTCLHIISSICFLFSEYSIYLGSYHLNMYSVFYSSISYLQGRHAFFGKPHFLQVLVLEDQPRTAKNRDLLQLAVQVPRLSVDWSDQKIQRRPHGEMISVLDIHIIYIYVYMYTY